MPTIYTKQELIRNAIDMQLEYGGYSCFKFGEPFRLYYLTYVCKLKYSYADYTDANPDGGFTHLVESGAWEAMSYDEQQLYRLEMLYYFWMANQEM